MEQFWLFALIGLGAGGMYALAALGLVLVHRTTGVVNFAHGAIGLLGAYAYWELHVGRNWGFWAAIVPSLLICAATGALVQLLVMWPLRRSSPLARLLATIGVLVTLQSAVALRYPAQGEQVSESLPHRGVDLFGAWVGEDRLLLFAIAIVLTMAIGALYRWTNFGRVSTAVADDPTVAASLGHSPGQIAVLNWSLASMLSGVAVILLSPLTGLSPDGLTSLLAPILAAATVGSMTSFPMTFVGGIIIGVGQSEISWYVHTPGWVDAIPFIVIMLVLLARGTSLPGRAHVRIALPRVGTGRVRPISLVLTVMLAIVIIEVLPLDWVNGTLTTIIAAVVMLSVVVVTGYAGQLSLAQYTLAGLGAFVAGRLVATHGLTFLLALVIAMAVALPIGVIVALPALRARGAQLAIATFALSVAIESLIFNNFNLTGGGNGTDVGTPRIFGIDISSIQFPQRYAIVCLVLFTMIGLAVANLRRSKVGRRLIAIRENERAAAALGVSVTAVKLYAFSIGSMIAAIGGVLLAFQNPIIDFSNYQAIASVTLVAQAVVGGVGYIAGPLFGGQLQSGGLGTSLGNLIFNENIQTYLIIAGGVGLILLLIQAPDGLAGQAARRAQQMRSLASRWLPTRRTAVKPNYLESALAEATAGWKVPARQLSASGLDVAFGGMRALSDLTITIEPGEVVGLIGPNGAGKTTCIDALSGFVNLRSGVVRYDGRDIGGRNPRQRAALGIGRSFQSLELFEDMNVLENILIACERCHWWSYVSDLFRPGRPKLSAFATATIEGLGLTADLDRRPTELPFGRRRLVALARAIAAEPSILLLDEPATGLSEQERTELTALIRSLATDRGMGVLLVEHDVEVVMRSCDRIVVLDFGRMTASGTPAAVRKNPDVVRAYLGAPADELAANTGTNAGTDTDTSASEREEVS